MKSTARGFGAIVVAVLYISGSFRWNPTRATCTDKHFALNQGLPIPDAKNEMPLGSHAGRFSFSGGLTADLRKVSKVFIPVDDDRGPTGLSGL
jgi:hypothetical protein